MATAVHLYSCPPARALDIEGLRDFLAAQLGGEHFAVEVRPEFFAFALRDAEEGVVERWAERFAASKVRFPRKAPPESLARKPLPQEVRYEARRLSARSIAAGVLYDGELYQRALRDMLPPAERSLGHVHLVFTTQLLGTFDASDGRYHARVVVAGFPSVLSTTGLVEGPARPREFYLAKRQHEAQGTGVVPELLAAAMGARIMHHDDERTTSALEGYATQAVLYQLTGEAFCPDPDCGLFNAHWQAEVVRAQVKGPGEPRFCARHEEVMARLRARGPQAP